jgi:hypothetical protein
MDAKIMNFVGNLTDKSGTKKIRGGREVVRIRSGLY